jgi:hypothetical protein
MYSRLKSEERFGAATAKWKPSKSGLPHRHVVVASPRNMLSPAKRIALQAILGSDPLREMLSMFRYLNGDPYPSLLAVHNGGDDEWISVEDAI